MMKLAYYTFFTFYLLTASAVGFAKNVDVKIDSALTICANLSEVACEEQNALKDANTDTSKHVEVKEIISERDANIVSVTENEIRQTTKKYALPFNFRRDIIERGLKMYPQLFGAQYSVEQLKGFVMSFSNLVLLLLILVYALKAIRKLYLPKVNHKVEKLNHQATSNSLPFSNKQR